jgi:hypothetical protein
LDISGFMSARPSKSLAPSAKLVPQSGNGNQNRSAHPMRHPSQAVAVIALMAVALGCVSAARSQDQPQRPAAPPPPDAGAPAAPPATPPATVLPKDEIQGVLGKDVRSSANESMGQIVNVIVDRAGQPRAAVIDFGGFLGVGSRKNALDWGALHFAPAQPPGPITLDLTRNELKAAPEYKEGQPVVVLSASGNEQPISIDTPARPEQ